MSETSAGNARRPWWKRSSSAALGFGLGATLALSPLVWAENPTAGATPAPTPPAATAPRQSFAPLVKRVLPAVVNISVTEKAVANELHGRPPEGFPQSPFDEFLRRYFEQQRSENQIGPRERQEAPDLTETPKRVALGSGFIVDAAGHVVTNDHVIGEAAKVEVTLQDGSKYTAALVGRDRRTDLALLKIDAGKPLPHVGFGDSDAAEVGDWVVAVGNPFGLGGTVTTGIISARGRELQSGQFDDFLQIDAPINRGNSGGPTFNLNGEVIGINTAIYSPNGGSVGLGFAVPATTAKKIVAELEAHGKITRGWLGVQIQAVTPEIAQSLGLHGAQGALVAALNPDGAGAKAGLKQGDVVVAFNGSDIKQLRDLPRLVTATAPGSSVAITVWRGGESVTLTATLAEAPENPQIAAADETKPNEAKADALGLHFGPLTSELRRELHVPREVHGVVVMQVDNGTLADNLGLGRGDVIVSINQEPVRAPQEAAAKFTEVANSPRKTALLLIHRRGMSQYVGVNLGRNHG